MSSEKYIGLDVHQATISVAVMVFLAAAEKTNHTNCLGRPINESLISGWRFSLNLFAASHVSSDTPATMQTT